jgi:hypothetical protein
MSQGFIPSDLPQLPEALGKLLRYILRRQPITLNELYAARQEIFEVPLTLGELNQYLETLDRQSLISSYMVAEERVYKALTRTVRHANMAGVWSSLAAQETAETQVNPELRKVRSALADKLLAKVEDLPQSETPPPPAPLADVDAQTAMKSLMGDLFSTGKKSMERRKAQFDEMSQKPEGD